jgi:hypothetical protein
MRAHHRRLVEPAQAVEQRLGDQQLGAGLGAAEAAIGSRSVVGVNVKVPVFQVRRCEVTARA